MSPERSLVDPEPAVRVLNVSKRFGDQEALRGVSLDLSPGRVHALIGENGSGKSTLIKVLSGYHAPSSGEVMVAGAQLPLGQPAASNRAGLRFVHQHLGLVPEMNAVENLGLGTGFANPGWIRWRDEAARAERELAELDIYMDVEKPLSEARAVERTSVAIARALRLGDGQELRLLVLDEPTAALPPHEVELLFSIIRRSTSRGLAVLYVSHRLDEIEEIADEVAVLRGGELVGNRTRGNVDHDTMVSLMLGDAPAHVSAQRTTVSRPVADNGGPPLLQVQDLATKTLRAVSFDVQRGEILGFVGIDGSGRDELARTLVGAIPADGTITVNGDRLRTISPAAAAKAGLTLVPSVTEPGSGVELFSVRENLTLASLSRMTDWRGVRRDREEAAVAEWIDRLDIRPPEPERQMSLLSGGNRQKVVVAKWLCLDNPIYVLSEPTAGVDIGARARIHEFVRTQAERGVGFVVCSTDINEVLAICTRIIVLREGRIVAEFDGEDATETTISQATMGMTTQLREET